MWDSQSFMAMFIFAGSVKQKEGIKMFTIIASGPNNIQVPCMFFNTENDACKYIEDAFAEFNVSDCLRRSEKEYDKFLNTECITYTFTEGELFDRGKNGYDEDLDLPDRLCSKFFTYYYGGCGECYAFSVVEVKIGVPMVKFDLD